jgi:hypothetical protein
MRTNVSHGGSSPLDLGLPEPTPIYDQLIKDLDLPSAVMLDLAVDTMGFEAAMDIVADVIRNMKGRR